MTNWLRDFIAQRSKSMREEKVTFLQEYFAPGCLILDVGVWSNMPELNPSENWMEKRYGDQVQIIAIGLTDMRGFHEKYPHVLCVQANGCALPFKSGAVTAAFSNAVLEHVPVSGQLRFVEEISRVAQKKVVMAVPDRLSPIEIHSRIFFLHWLPFWRSLFRILGKPYWASEENLSIIFTQRSLAKLLAGSLSTGTWRILRQSLFFMPVSLIAIFEKTKGPETRPPFSIS